MFVLKYVEAVTAYYLVRNFDTTNTAEAQAVMGNSIECSFGRTDLETPTTQCL